MNYSVIIPSARPANLVSCVRALRTNEPDLPPERILIVDDGARAQAEAELPGIRWIDGIKPFVFARNVNRGLQQVDTDVILLNDDAHLVTRSGLTQLVAMARRRGKIGICSAGIRGVVGNRNQQARGSASWRAEFDTLAFVCVYIAREAIAQIGPLDEQFVGYGFEDNDYCRRAMAAGFQLAVWDGCVVDHDKNGLSTYRSRGDIRPLLDANRKLFERKWHGGNADVDILFLGCNRLEFTRETFEALILNTDWDLVRTLFVIDDGSCDGTREWLQQNLARVPRPTRFLKTSFGSPVTAMVEFIRQSSAPILAKTDNDAMLPPGWLRQSRDVLSRHPELSLLGIEAMYPHDPDASVARSYTTAEFISGLGLYRRKAFARTQPHAYNKWFGLEEWQVRQGAGLKRGWITPALPVFLLDRIPFDPWAAHSENYVQRGWQRSWPKYDPSSTLWHWRWPEAVARPQGERHAATAVERPSFVGAMRIKNEAPHIREVIDSILPLCQRVLVFDDHSSDDTAATCRSFGERVLLYSSEFQGLDEARDKNFLLGKVVSADPDWVLWIDGDEILERSGPEALRAATKRPSGPAAYSLRIAYVWDKPEQIRVDGIYGKFRRPSLFRLHGQPTSALHFPATAFGGNLHCGNVPRGLVGAAANLEVRLKHLGYMDRARRQEKYELYNRIDPNNGLEDCYRHLIEIRGARHAPGPPQFVAWSE
jgi:GT2 family glycosyltransferase